MFDFIGKSKNSAAHPGLYCVWIRAREGEKAPLIQVWIDPSMGMFDSNPKAQETEFAATSAEGQGAVFHEGNS